MKRPTISDIAKAAGVSKGAASYALNGRPGVSETTRQRVLAIADELGWVASSAARSLSDGKAGAIGLVVDRPARVLGIEPFFMQLISGVQDALANGPVALLWQVADNAEAELAAYRTWWAQRRVDGVLLMDLRINDPRVKLVHDVGLPAVALAGPEGAGGLPCVWTDDGVAIAEVVEHLVSLGHRRIARVAGPAYFEHTRLRSLAFTAATARQGLTGGRTVHTDYSDEEGARATRDLLAGPDRPTALLFDNDVMAVAALGAAQEMGIAVPEELSLVAWDDSVLCRLVRPSLTAVRRPIAERGATAANMLVEVVAGRGGGEIRTADPVLVQRGSTAPVS
ncbi:DNA-binding LacI/PurR family transcriptional regulator [Crossiella equi]|uniref:DNA-binding LacI/PurR family transcriptional regulator n=1 Tax=Crossiella equi TaxID=130796 RepID=A0ABS5ARS0_9PSEU|nr:LacI family DNA-binding transcriptional regulator [Crossiella equi]MBP2479082.1 DNA-binding LacI/PurR family transcriptional regulator [Crossiella equi]